MKKTITIQIGDSFIVAISFMAGCFGFGWIPFGVIMLILILGESSKEEE